MTRLDMGERWHGDTGALRDHLLPLALPLTDRTDRGAECWLGSR
jgi:hypothetical protein